MEKRDIIVIGTSAGGVETLSQLVKLLPADLPAVLCVVLHIMPYGFSVLPKILSRAGEMEASHPHIEQALQYSKIFVAPPNYHLLVKRGFVKLSQGPHENGHRPAVDVLFRSAAQTYGSRVIGVVLSGMLDDGSAGSGVIRARKGLVIAQDPEEALYSSMPRNVIENVGADFVLSVPQIASKLIELTRQNDPQRPEFEQGQNDLDTTEMEHSQAQPTSNGHVSIFVCPECGGALWEYDEGGMMRYRCRVGHAYSPDTLAAEHSEGLNDALWTALRVLEEHADLQRRVAQHARSKGRVLTAQQAERKVQESEAKADIVRNALLNPNSHTLEADVSEIEGID